MMGLLLKSRAAGRSIFKWAAFGDANCTKDLDRLGQVGGRVAGVALLEIRKEVAGGDLIHQEQGLATVRTRGPGPQFAVAGWQRRVGVWIDRVLPVVSRLPATPISTAAVSLRRATKPRSPTRGSQSTVCAVRLVDWVLARPAMPMRSLMLTE
jgi:hypothetical protein